MKLHKLFFYLLLFYIPVNLGKHFIFKFAYFDGLLIDYLIPTIYFQDIAICIILAIFIYETSFSELKRFVRFTLNLDWISTILCLLFVSLFLSSLTSINTWASLHILLRFVLYIMFALYVGYTVNFRKEWLNIIQILFVSLFLISVLSLLQWFTQGSIFDNYLFFGEQPYSVSSYNVYKQNVFGYLLVPPYATFRHPNILAGYISVILIWVLYSLSFFNFPKTRRILFLSIPIFVTLLLTFSAIPIVFGSIVALFLVIRPHLYVSRQSVLIFLFVLVVGCLSFPYIATKVGSNIPSITKRNDLIVATLKVQPERFLFGYGLGTNPQVLYPNLMSITGVKHPQPVHNIFLMLFSESGIFTLFFVSLLFIYLITSTKFSFGIFSLSLVLIMLISLFDHYFWTIHQTFLLLCLTLGFYISYNFHNKENSLNI